MPEADICKKNQEFKSGFIKRYNDKGGYGYIKIDDDSTDAFFHIRWVLDKDASDVFEKDSVFFKTRPSALKKEEIEAYDIKRQCNKEDQYGVIVSIKKPMALIINTDGDKFWFPCNNIKKRNQTPFKSEYVKFSLKINEHRKLAHNVPAIHGES